MTISLYHYLLILVSAPLIGSVVSGVAAKRIGVRGAHFLTIFLMSVSFLCSCLLFKAVIFDNQRFSGTVYHWAISSGFEFNVGFLLDSLSAIMIVVVTFVSLLVHIYSIGYMKGDTSNQRFFSYVSLFTFAMLMLVLANNFMQLFFGWEGVGVVSYLLIGFWFTKESAASGSLKAFIVNRVGDFGFIIAIAAIISTFGTVDYASIFSQAAQHATDTLEISSLFTVHTMTFIGLFLFIGAMAKSAQIPLHVWLPESMEGPTPISALIHAATMVTAGIFMVARMSPLFEWSQMALSVILVVGSTGGLFLGLLAFVENDIKRVIAYSTMSQLGYMMAANGVSAYSAGIFHLATHACFKALLFLSAGSVIIALHHEQDLRKMGNLRRYLPVTYVCFLVGALALAAVPPFSGFYSKDAIIEAVHLSSIPGAHYAYFCLLLGAFVTSYYIFRAFFLTFHGEERFDDSVDRSQIKEYGVMLFPLIALAIPSAILGIFIVKPMLFSMPTWLSTSVMALPAHDVLSIMRDKFHGLWSMTWHSVMTAPLWLSLLGILFAYRGTLYKTNWGATWKKSFPMLYYILKKNYGFDAFNHWVIVRPITAMSRFFYKVLDLSVIDNHLVDASGRRALQLSQLLRRLQTGYLYHYVFVMMVGLLAFLVWMII